MSRLLPYETIIQATNGEPEAVNAVLAITVQTFELLCQLAQFTAGVTDFKG